MTNELDFNDAEPQKTGFDLIPANTVAPMTISIRAGGEGSDGSLTQSKSSDVQFLNVEFTITEGPFVRRKIFQNLTVSGGTVDEKGRSKAGNITKSFIRGALESAHGIAPDDDSPQARKKRTISSYGDLNGLTFTGKIGIEKGKDGYPDKNKVISALNKKDEKSSSVSASPVKAPAAPANMWE